MFTISAASSRPCSRQNSLKFGESGVVVPSRTTRSRQGLRHRGPRPRGLRRSPQRERLPTYADRPEPLRNRRDPHRPARATLSRLAGHPAQHGADPRPPAARAAPDHRAQEPAVLGLSRSHRTPTAPRRPSTPARAHAAAAPAGAQARRGLRGRARLRDPRLDPGDKRDHRSLLRTVECTPRTCPIFRGHRTSACRRFPHKPPD